ncbi:MAG TPA: PAS domain S-box protein [Syntrophorhabdaceae bacterium]|jgi:PAS domain S-box-containing protein
MEGVREENGKVATLREGGKKGGSDRNRRARGAREEGICRLIFETAYDGIFVLKEGFIADFNESLRFALGGSREDIIGKSLADLGPAVQPSGEESRDKAVRIVEQAFNGEVQRFEWTFLRCDGTAFDAEVTLHVIDGTGEKILAGTIRDITERKARERSLSEAAARYRDIFDYATEGMFQSTPEGRYMQVNPALARIMGYESPEGMIHEITSIREQVFMKPEARARLMNLLEKDGHVEGFEAQFLRKDGTVIWVSTDARVVEDGEGEALYFEGLTRDITERKKSQEALRKERETFLTILDNFPHGAALISEEGAYLYVNHKFSEITGYTLADIPSGQEWFVLAFPDPEQRRNAVSAWMMDMRNKGAGEREGKIFSIRCKDSAQKFLNLVTVKLETGSFIVSFEDVTEKQKKEETLLLTQFSIDHASDAIFWIKPSSRFLYVNEASRRMLGYTPDELLDLSFFQVDVDHPAEEGGRLWKRVKEHGSMAFESRFRAKDGKVFPVEITANYVHFRGRNYVLFFVRDITERKKGEEALHMEKERLAVTLGSIGDGVIATDTEGRIILLNAVAEQLTGWPHEEAAGKPLAEVFHIINEKTGETCESPATKVLKTGKVVGLANHTVLVSRDGREFIIADSGAPITRSDGTVIGVVLVFRDQTEKRKTDEELSRISRLESISVLAGGIAHDFNNILSILLGSISLARTYIGRDEEKAVAKCKDAEAAVSRAKDLTQQLLTFAKGGSPVKQKSTISDILRESAQFALTGSPTRCEFELSEYLSPVEVDQGQISQVISNLVINADQAMPQGGVITIKAENAVWEEERRRHGFPLAAGRYMKISVSDQGGGVPKEHLAKIFEPYFTTKKKGSGLGLAMAHSIVKNHDGYITAESESGEGSVFTIFCPPPRQIRPRRTERPKKAIRKCWAGSFSWTMKR